MSQSLPVTSSPKPVLSWSDDFLEVEVQVKSDKQASPQSFEGTIRLLDVPDPSIEEIGSYQKRRDSVKANSFGGWLDRVP